MLAPPVQSGKRRLPIVQPSVIASAALAGVALVQQQRHQHRRGDPGAERVHLPCRKHDHLAGPEPAAAERHADLDIALQALDGAFVVDMVLGLVVPAGSTRCCSCSRAVLIRLVLTASASAGPSGPMPMTSSCLAWGRAMARAPSVVMRGGQAACRARGLGWQPPRLLEAAGQPLAQRRIHRLRLLHRRHVPALLHHHEARARDARVDLLAHTRAAGWRPRARTARASGRRSGPASAGCRCGR